MKKIIPSLILTVILGAAAALAQDAPAPGLVPARLPRIAVYVTGSGVSENEKKALGTRMLASLVNSGRYMGIERASSFLDEIDKEQLKQRSGAIDDNQISALGKQFGVSFVCIADITPVLGDFQVSARIVNVETAHVSFIGESYSRLKNVVDLVQVSDQVVRNMFSGQVATLREPKPESAQEPPPPVATAAEQQPKQDTPAQGVQESVWAEMEREEWEELERQDKKAMEAEMGRVEKMWAKERRLEQTALKKVKIGGGVGMGVSGKPFLDVGVAGAYLVNKNMQFAPQISYRIKTGKGGVDFSGVSVPLLIQFSTDYRRFTAVFAEGGVGFDLLSDGFGASVFNSEVIVGGGVAFGRCVHIDVIRFNLGTAYHSCNIMNVRVMF